MPTDPSDSEVVPNVEASARLVTFVHESMDGFKVPFAVVAGIGVIAFAVQSILGYLNRIHWVFGALFSIVVVLVSVWAIQKAKRSPLASTRAMGAVVLSVGLLAAVIIAGGASMTLNTLGIGTYVASSTPSLNSFTRLYFYTLADLMPAIKITETLHIQRPIEPQNFAAGLPVLLFRIFVLWFLFDAFKSWRKSRKDQGKEKSTDIVLYAILLLVFVVAVFATERVQALK